MLLNRSLAATIIVIASTLPGLVLADEHSRLVAEFSSAVLPVLRQHCLECHASEDPEAMFDLSRFRKSDDVAKDFAIWQHVVDRVGAGEMPPPDAEQPSRGKRDALLNWSRSFRTYEANRNAGDPGPVLARRLSAAEYNNTIRDLTGVDIRPARHFPVDRANQEGFDNTGESLEMTPGLLMKYLDAARAVSQHLVLEPAGLSFAPHPVVGDTDRDKYCVRRIVDFYERQNTDYADYFCAAWRLRQLAPKTTAEFSSDFETLLAAVARREGVSPKYLQTVWSLLSGKQHHFGPIAKLRSLWRALPDGEEELQQVLSGCAEMSEFVSQLRPGLAHSFPSLSHKGINSGTQSFVLWRNRQYATHRRSLNQEALQVVPADRAQVRQLREKKNQETIRARRQRQSEIDDELKQLEADVMRLVTAKKITKYQAEKKVARARDALDKELSQFRLEKPTPSDLMIPSDEEQQRQHVAAFAVFCDVFPDRFYVKSRGREYKGLQGQQYADEAKVRLLSAGFHSQMGFFRDDAPLYDLVLNEREQQQLDDLWHELDFIADVSRRQHQGYIWYERGESSFLTGPEFDFARGEDEDITTEEKIHRLAKVYLAKAKRTGASDEVLRAIGDHFRIVNTNIRKVERARNQAESKHIDALNTFAERAYRRPLSDNEASSITEFYHTLRTSDGLSHEDATRDVVVRILASPHFCYSTQPSEASDPVHPLSQYALASRLSYFLWSSTPDDQLLASAERGELHDPIVIKSHVRRMIGDDRIRGFAQQFAGNWLGYAGFEDHKGVNRDRFPQFDDELRQAMCREPAELFIDLLRRDGSLLELLDAEYTFVDATLARHYGIKGAGLEAGEWKRIDGAGKYGRGGILSMSVFLTRNAHPLRTSPVQRGYWVASQLLGERIPPPPANVPELPQDESKLGESSLADVLAKHREHAACAVCHDRFDALGIALEGFDPIGQTRDVDLGGKSVDTTVQMPDGIERKGVAGLRDYIREHRQQDFIDNACLKLLSYALGRTLIVADDSLLDSMRKKLDRSDYRMTGLIEVIVTSPPFLTQRGRNYQKDILDD